MSDAYAYGLAKQIDAALGRYYAQKNVNIYFNDEGVGKFMTFCKENGTCVFAFLLSLILITRRLDCGFGRLQ